MGNIYTGDLVKKAGGNLDKDQVGVVLAIARAHCGGNIYKVIVILILISIE